MPTSKPSASPKVKKLKGENLKEEIKSGEFIAVAADASGETLEGDGVGGQQVQFVMAADGEDGEHEGAQTIVLGSDAAAQYVDSNGQDMIVVIQSDDFDQSQVNTLLDRRDCTNALLWSKTTLITGGVGGAGVDPPS